MHTEKNNFFFNSVHINQKMVLANLTYSNKIYTKMSPNFVLSASFLLSIAGSLRWETHWELLWKSSGEIKTKDVYL